MFRSWSQSMRCMLWLKHGERRKDLAEIADKRAIASVSSVAQMGGPASINWLVPGAGLRQTSGRQPADGINHAAGQLAPTNRNVQ